MAETGAAMRPNMNVARHARSLPAGSIMPPAMPVMPAIRPLNVISRPAQSPISAPPIAAETGVKLAMICLFAYLSRWGGGSGGSYRKLGSPSPDFLATLRSPCRVSEPVRARGDRDRNQEASMDFSLSPEIEDLRVRTRKFVDEHVLPLESDPTNFSDHENIPHDRLEPIRAKARQAGLWAPQSPKEYGGMDLPIVAWAVMYEEAARSLFGPLALNCMAPDDGNMNVLKKLGTPAQKEKWLKPIVEGKVRSSFAMTEPAPGGGSDPSMIKTYAEKHGSTWKIHGRKWFITGADGAAHFIL